MSTYKTRRRMVSDLDDSTPEDFEAVGDGLTDDTDALNDWQSYLKTNNLNGRLPAKTYAFATALAWTGSNWGITGADPYLSVLKYIGANTTNDIIKIGAAPYTEHVCLSRFRITSNTTMTGGAALHLVDFVDSFLDEVTIDGIQGTHKLYNGVWFDRVDTVFYQGIDLYATNRGIIVNGLIGAGAKAELSISRGRLGGGAMGIFVGGGFGGLYVDNISISGVAIGIGVGTDLVAEGNRELFFGTGVVIDGATSSGILLNDGLTSNGAFIFNGWVASNGGYGFEISQWANSLVLIQGGMIFNNTLGGIAASDPTMRLQISSGVTIRNNGGYAIIGNASVALFCDALLYSNASGSFNGVSNAAGWGH